MINELLNNLDKDVDSYIEEYIELFVIRFVNQIFTESNFDNVNKIINYINEPTSTWKNNIIYKLSDAFNSIKYDNIPLQRLIFNESYKLMANDADRYIIDRNFELYVNDLYFYLLKNDSDNEKVKSLKYYLLMLNIIWLIDFKWSNIYFLIQSNLHDEYYNQLLFHIIDRFTKKIGMTDYYWYTPRIVYSNFVYTDIIDYKYKNYNTLINSVWVYKLLHKLYINNKWVDENIIKEKLIEGIVWESHISNKYSSDENILKLMNLLKNPYTSEVDVLQIKSYWDDSAPSWAVTEESLWMSDDNTQINWTIEEVVWLMWWDLKDPFFFVLFDIFYSKINTKILYQLKDFEDIFKQSIFSLSLLFNDKNYTDSQKHKILLNNINYIEQYRIISQKKTKYSTLYDSIRESF